MAGSATIKHTNNNHSLSRDYKIGGLLGRGGFGVVFAGLRRMDGMKVAIKAVTKEKAAVTEDNVPLEAVLMRQVVEVPGVVKILDCIETQETFYIVMERFSTEDLFDFISDRGTLTEPLARYTEQYSSNLIIIYIFKENFRTSLGKCFGVPQERSFSQ